MDGLLIVYFFSVFSIVSSLLLLFFFNKQRKLGQLLVQMQKYLEQKARILAFYQTVGRLISGSGNTQISAQKIADTVPGLLGYSMGILAFVDEDKKAITYRVLSKKGLNGEIQKDLAPQKISIPLSNTKNLTVSAIEQKMRLTTEDCLAILTPVLTPEQSNRIQIALSINKVMIEPFFYQKKPVGALLLFSASNETDINEIPGEIFEEMIRCIGIVFIYLYLAYHKEKTAEDIERSRLYYQEIDSIRDEFLSITSHELRTPMTAIKSYAWMLLNDKTGGLEPKANEYVKRIYNSCDRLINLLNEMIDVTRIKSHKFHLRREAFDIIALIEEVKVELQSAMRDRRLTFEETHDYDLPRVYADREKIFLVLEHIIGNAIKFTPKEGFIHVHTATDEDMIRVSVKDNGIGISKDDLPKLFMKFGKLGNKITVLSESGGNGLGLYLCKFFIELHKGKIWAESQKEKGATFTFTLPVYLEQSDII